MFVMIQNTQSVLRFPIGGNNSAQDTIAAVERSVGLAHFARGSDTGRIARDLATYCRQVARDAMEQRSGRILLARKGPLSDVWHG